MEQYTQYLVCIAHPSIPFFILDGSEMATGKRPRPSAGLTCKVREIRVVHAQLPPIMGVRLDASDSNMSK